LSPAYDLVSTAVYYAGGTADNLALKFGGSKAYNMVSLTTFRALQRRLDAKDAYLPEQVEETVSSVLENWPQAEDRFRDLPQLRTSISESIDNYSKTLMRRLNRY
jgi:serine/threonine-protein kinase HipA